MHMLYTPVPRHVLLREDAAAGVSATGQAGK